MNKALWLAELIERDPCSKDHHDQAASELRSQRDRIERLICGLDCLGMAIADAGYAWTPAMRDAYESCFFNHKAKGNNMERELSFGQKAVGLEFNPSGDEAVGNIKRACAELIDCLDAYRGRLGPEQDRMLSLAITDIQTAQMWAVKAVTWKY